MDNYTELVREYKKTNSPALMNKIYQELNPLVQTKASFIFYRKYYPLSLYNLCYPCQKCDNKLESNCKTCKKCTCITGTFNLSKTGLCEVEDVENDLWIEILRIIKNYDVTKDFDTYLYSCIWNVIPSFLTMDFIKSLQHKSLDIPLGDFKDYENEEDRTPTDCTSDSLLEKKFNLEVIFDSCKTEIEKNVLKAISAGYNQREIAEQLKVTPAYISMLIKDVKERIKKIVEEDR